MVIAVLRIVGRANNDQDINETLKRLKLWTKLSCTFIDEKDDVKMGMVRKVMHYVSFGKVDKALMDEIISKRGVKDIEGNYKGYCRLHPPRGGFRKSTQTTAPKGILGENKDIDKLLKRML